MTFGVVLFDMFELGAILERRDVPIQVPEPFVQRWVSGADVSDVAFEVLHVDHVESDDSGIQPYICLGDLLPVVKRGGIFIQVSFSAVQGSEEGAKRLFVSFLCPS